MKPADFNWCPPAPDRNDPDPWLALELDPASPLDPRARTALARSQRSASRRFLAPAVKVVGRAATWLFCLLRHILPNGLQASGFLHRLIGWSMMAILKPEATYLVFRHFYIGSQVLAFMAKNAGLDVKEEDLEPQDARAMFDNIFVKHDLNLYNALIELGATGKPIKTVPFDQLDFSMIQDFDDRMDLPKPVWHRFIDMETALEGFAPLFALLLSRKDFDRAAHSLQFDATVGGILGQIVGLEGAAHMPTNRLPFMPEAKAFTARRLLIHGIESEVLYGMLRAMKVKQAQAQDKAHAH